MEKFIIKEIKAYFDERWLTLERINDGRKFKVYFMEFSEEICKTSNTNVKRKVGDILEGNLFIGWITEIKKINSKLMYIQNDKYSGIEAVVEITEVLTNSTFYAKNSILSRDIILKMEKDMDLNKGDRIYLGGNLQIELEEYTERLGLLED